MPQQVLSLLEQKGNAWLTAGSRGRYHAILLDNPNFSPKTVSKLNSASLLPEPDSAALIHDSAEILTLAELIYRTMLQKRQMEAVIQTKETKAGYGVVTLEEQWRLGLAAGSLCSES